MREFIVRLLILNALGGCIVVSSFLVQIVNSLDYWFLCFDNRYFTCCMVLLCECWKISPDWCIARQIIESRHFSFKLLVYHLGYAHFFVFRLELLVICFVAPCFSLSSKIIVVSQLCRSVIGYRQVDLVCRR